MQCIHKIQIKGPASYNNEIRWLSSFTGGIAVPSGRRLTYVHASSEEGSNRKVNGVGARGQDVSALFEPFKVGKHYLSNRLVFPPLNRMRANKSGVPQTHAATYYAQRAQQGGLMIAEATYIADKAVGYGRSPAIFTEEHINGWKQVTKAVKDKGGVFFCQIWHTGRAAHPALNDGATPVAPSAFPISRKYSTMGYDFNPVNYVTPRALTEPEIKDMVQAFRQGARNAVTAGFDGVEVHAGHGYLIDQFTKSSSNRRTDKYGGCIENRCRFALEVVEAVADEIGADKVGIRMSPFSTFLDAVDDTPYATFTYLVEQLNKHDLAYLHMVEPRIDGATESSKPAGSLEPFRKVWRGPFIAAGGYTAVSGAQAVASGHADLIAYGRQWISNPDLPQRFRTGAKLTPYDRDTFYTLGPEGYIDYPLMDGTIPGMKPATAIEQQ